jgi:diamine N-acetyltransferase
MLKYKTLYGTGCYLTPMTIDDAIDVVKLRTENATYMKNHPEDKTNIEVHKAWFNRYIERKKDIHWLIRNKQNNAIVGQTALSDFDFVSNKVRTGPILLNDDARIFAFESEFLKLQYAFEELDMNKVYVHSRTASTEAINFIKKLGFIHDGYLRQDWWNGFEHIDYYLFSMLKEEYHKNKEMIYKPYLHKLTQLFSKTQKP